jgi:protein Jumonji
VHKKLEESSSDVETSSRESSRNKSTALKMRKMELLKREGRSASCDSSGSNRSSSEAAQKSSSTSRPPRKTKEAASVYLNILGQKLKAAKDNDEDNISISSLSEVTQERRLEELENEQRGKKKEKSASKVN